MIDSQVYAYSVQKQEIDIISECHLLYCSIAGIVERYKKEKIVDGATLGKAVLKVSVLNLEFGLRSKSSNLRENKPISQLNKLQYP